jgi:hypothetical protein
MWRILVPPVLHVFLWLLANNKVLTRDNLAKRKNIDDKTCLFCNESETVLHLFFECCVAHQPIWEIISEVSCLPLIKDIQPLSKIWWRGKNFKAFNVIWSIWNTRNNLCFQGVCWTKMEMWRCAKLIRKLSNCGETGSLVSSARKKEVQDLLVWHGFKVQGLRLLMGWRSC